MSSKRILSSASKIGPSLLLLNSRSSFAAFSCMIITELDRFILAFTLNVLGDKYPNILSTSEENISSASLPLVLGLNNLNFVMPLIFSCSR